MRGDNAQKPLVDNVTEEWPPHGPQSGVDAAGPCDARRCLYRRFESRIHVSPVLTRKLVSYQGNKEEAGLRWLKYKEGFSSKLVGLLLEEARPGRVLDPFSGAGTAVLTSCGMGRNATGIEIMPVGNLAARAVAAASNQLGVADVQEAGEALLGFIRKGQYKEEYLFPHVPITRHAFPQATEEHLACARNFIDNLSDSVLSSILTLACVSVLEEISYTRKDGQFLRWDPQSGRNVAQRLHKEVVPTLEEALRLRLDQIIADIPVLRTRYRGPKPEFVDGSSLMKLKELPAKSFDAVVTSPPYANRYDYTRTYALELAYLGHGVDDFKNLRQQLLTATVENRSKYSVLAETYGADKLFSEALQMANSQEALQEVLQILRDNVTSLSNASVITLVENYFIEMSVIIRELGRLIVSGGTVFMVNDNVQYHGQEAPVDLILSDFAEQSGFQCVGIWTLNRGKGNSSQQMGRFGRQELRKCVYQWVKLDD